MKLYFLSIFLIQKNYYTISALCLDAINTLEKQELISKDPANGMAVVSTAYGRLMARFFLSLKTMRLFQRVYEISLIII